MKNSIILFLLIFSMFVFATEVTRLIELKNGEKIRCSIISEEEGVLTVISDSFGEIKINRIDISMVTELNATTGYKYDDPNHNSLLFMPSAETNPKGTKYFSSYELLYINSGFTPVENFQFAIGCIFPIVPEMLTNGPLSFGAKWRISHEPYKHNFSVMSSITTVIESDNFNLLSFGGALNYYFNPKTTINFYAGLLSSTVGNSDSMFNFGIGLTRRTSESSKIIVEYLNGMFEEFRSEGILMFGLRFFGEKISADFAAVKFMNIGGDSEPWVLIPLVSLTYHF